ncbi:MAG: RNA ligase family protein [Pseudomonadota bacterium]|nr:RNA ligase family protein [Pseudomonadota bacterium]
MGDFFRFPHTPHLAWLGAGAPRDDKLLLDSEVQELLAGPVIVEEKVDGANLGISLSESGELRVQNRGNYLSEPFRDQFSRLNGWLAQHRFELADALGANLILFGEWCAAKHSLDYAALPDWFVVFDVYDRSAQRFWSCERRDALAQSLHLVTVPRLFTGTATLAELTRLLQNSTSAYRPGPPEGIVMRKDSAMWSELRAKLVRAEFTQTIGEHWRSRSIEWNQVARSNSE